MKKGQRMRNQNKLLTITILIIVNLALLMLLIFQNPVRKDNKLTTQDKIEAVKLISDEINVWMADEFTKLKVPNGKLNSFVIYEINFLDSTFNYTDEVYDFYFYYGIPRAMQFYVISILDWNIINDVYYIKYEKVRKDYEIPHKGILVFDKQDSIRFIGNIFFK